MAKLPSIEVESSQHPHISNPFKKALATLVLLGAGVNLNAQMPQRDPGASQELYTKLLSDPNMVPPSPSNIHFKLPQQAPSAEMLIPDKPYFFEWKSEVWQCVKYHPDPWYDGSTPCMKTNMARAQTMMAMGVSSNKLDSNDQVASR